MIELPQSWHALCGLKFTLIYVECGKHLHLELELMWTSQTTVYVDIIFNVPLY